MKSKYSFIFCFVFCFNAHSQLDSLLLSYEHYTLKNGLEVILQPDQDVKDVSVEFWLRDGIRTDNSTQYGFTHFFEHVMPYAAMDSIELSRFNTYRTNNNAQVRKDYIRFYTQVVSEGLSVALKIVAGRLKAGPNRITEKRVEFQRERVLSEIDRVAKNYPLWSPEGGTAIFEGTFGEKHPYGSSAYGLIENNKAFKLKDFREHYKKIVYADNTVLFLVGNFNIEDAKKLIDIHFSDIHSKKKLPETIKQAKHLSKSLTMKAPHPNDTLNTLALSWSVSKWGSRDHGALKLIASILNNRIEAESRSLKTVIKSNVDTEMYQFGGRFLIQASFSSTKDSTILENLIFKTLDGLIKKGVTERELIDAQKNEVAVIKKIQQKLGFQASRTELLGEGLLFTENPTFYYEVLKSQLSLNRKDIKNVAKKWLEKPPYRILFVSNKEEE
ncbi:pitrilysin family protein [Leptobacterium sp. I13]|uniref:M16 family metallopeptidase n=1 Tax=Leptobacterium meishanense TaxID=3128904 RepID=UPI0030EDA349